MSTYSSKSSTSMHRPKVTTGQDNVLSHQPESYKRQRRAPNELVWTQPRTIPASLHKNARRLSTPPAVSTNKVSSTQGHSGQQKQHQTSFSSLLTPSTQSKDDPMDADFLDLGDTFGLGDDVVQNLLDCSTSLPETPQSLTRMLHIEPSSLDSRLSLADDDMPASDNHIPATRDCRANLSALNGFSAIHLAAYFGKFPIIRTLLSVCPENVDVLNHIGQTPLHIAASEGHMEVIPELLNSGANPVLQDAHGHTALHLAVSRGHLDVVRLLLDGTHSQSMIRMVDGAGKTCLHQAVLQEYDEIVRLLLERGADPRTPVG